MAEERDDSQRTEEPTQKRLEDAYKKGDVVKSSELTSFVLLSGGALALLFAAGLSGRTFLSRFTVYLEQPDQIVLGPGGVMAVAYQAVLGLFAVAAPATLILYLAAFSGHVLQHRPVFAVEKLRPDLSKLSLVKGFKRLFGLDGIANLIKGVLKIGAVGAAAFIAVWPERGRLAVSMSLEPAGIAGLALMLAMKAILAALIVLAVIAVLDYLYQRQRFYSRNRMTRQELKDEFKQSEGDPQVKARIRQVRQERARKRMMAAVPEATVVITNPTHYAVALKYESGKMPAPLCVAKGVDSVALRIREVAEEHDVPVVENPPLARALYGSVELDEPIPAEHYKAVASVIGYVMKLAAARRYWRD